MKKTVTTLFFACSVFSGFGEVLYGSTESLVEKVFRTGGYDGHLTKQLRTLGDDGAVAVARVVSENPLTSVQVEIVLTLLEDSFSDVMSIQVASSREPRVALLLLRYLECSTRDSGLKKKIGDTRKSLTQIATSQRVK